MGFGTAQGAVPSMEEGRQQNTDYLNASAAAERLQRNVNREHFLCTDFLLAFWQVRMCFHSLGRVCCQARTQHIVSCDHSLGIQESATSALPLYPALD